MKKLQNFITHTTERFYTMSSKLKDDIDLLALGKMLSNQQYLLQSTNINDYEFKIFSQHGDDGIIQYLIKNIKIDNEIFIEFGVEDYTEATTRFLMMNNNWSGFVMDGSPEAMQRLQKRKWFWTYDLTFKAVFIDKDNINDLLSNTGFKNIGLLHIDLDGNDYHILQAIDLSKLNPSIIILEYNSVFGKDRAITVPYNKNFYKTNAHYSNQYYGASLTALTHLANQKGYTLIGCASAGHNAYYVRKDLLNEKVKELPINVAYKESKFRDSRDKNGAFTYLSGSERLALLQGLDVLNTDTNTIEKL